MYFTKQYHNTANVPTHSKIATVDKLSTIATNTIENNTSTYKIILVNILCIKFYCVNDFWNENSHSSLVCVKHISNTRLEITKLSVFIKLQLVLHTLDGVIDLAFWKFVHYFLIFVVKLLNCIHWTTLHWDFNQCAKFLLLFIGKQILFIRFSIYRKEYTIVQRVIAFSFGNSLLISSTT